MSSLTTLALTCNMLSTIPDGHPLLGSPFLAKIAILHSYFANCLTNLAELGIDEFGRWNGGLLNLTSLHLSANQLRIVPR
jgi:Leucine-rich repeat (LRR) protein